MNFKEIFEKIKSETKEKIFGNKIIANFLIVFLVGILILVASSFFKSTGNSGKSLSVNSNPEIKEENIQNNKNSEEEEDLKFDLKNILQQTEGVGRVEVMIYFESGEEQVPAFNVNDSTNLTEEVDNEGGTRKTTQKNNGTSVVITNDGNQTKPLIIKKNKPKITGVLVVAEGAENKVTEYRIRKAVTNLFNIPDNKVNVYPMKK